MREVTCFFGGAGIAAWLIIAFFVFVAGALLDPLGRGTYWRALGWPWDIARYWWETSR
jgi:hypothetical protein